MGCNLILFKLVMLLKLVLFVEYVKYFINEDSFDFLKLIFVFIVLMFILNILSKFL